MSLYNVQTTPGFEKEFKKLKKRFRSIVDDFEDFLNEIEGNGDLGFPIPGVGISNGNKLFKKRMSNSSANEGKSSGFRIIEYLMTDSNEVFLLDIYYKGDQENISNKQIRKLVKDNEWVFLKYKGKGLSVK